MENDLFCLRYACCMCTVESYFTVCVIPLEDISRLTYVVDGCDLYC